jgi:hypothetical protein
MAIKYQIEKYTYPDGRITEVFRLQEPFQDLNIIKAYTDVDDLDYFIGWLEDLIVRSVPDFSEPGGIEYQGIMWGSVKSKIIELVRNGPSIEKEEFETKDLLEVCRDWRNFLIEKIDGKRK